MLFRLSTALFSQDFEPGQPGELPVLSRVQSFQWFTGISGCENWTGWCRVSIVLKLLLFFLNHDRSRQDPSFAYLLPRTFPCGTNSCDLDLQVRLDFGKILHQVIDGESPMPVIQDLAHTSFAEVQDSRQFPLRHSVLATVADELRTEVMLKNVHRAGVGWKACRTFDLRQFAVHFLERFLAGVIKFLTCHGIAF